MRYRFDKFELDTDRLEFVADGRAQALEPQVLDVLRHLVENSDRLVTRDELIEAVWGGRIVSDATVSARINGVRRALGDSGERQAFVKTVPRRGFRFVVPVHAAERPAGDDGTAARADEADVDALPEKPSLVVLPFVDMTSDPDHAFLADGLTEEITTALSRHRWLFVISRNTAFAYKGRAVDVNAVGRELAVRYVLEGSVRKAGDRIRANVQLVDAHTRKQVWADRYEYVLRDVFDLQDEIVANVCGALELGLLDAEKDRSEKRSAESLTAWEFVVRATPLVWVNNPEAFAEANAFLARALALDPGYARAYSLLAIAHVMSAWMGWGDDTQQTLAVAEANAAKAIELDSRDPWAHVAKGLAKGLRRENADALRDFDTAIRLNPNFALAHAFHGIVLAWGGEWQAALESFDLAERLSPLDPFNIGIPPMRATALIAAGKFDEAAAAARDGVRMKTSAAGPYRVLAAACGLAGHLDEARAAMDQLKRMQPSISAGWMRGNFPFVRQEDLDTYIAGLTAAGMSE
jgi:TolB-like protein